MDPFAFGPFQAVLDFAYSAVAALGTALAPFAGASSAALAIALATVIVRIAMLPLGIAAAKSSAAARRLAPQVAELRRRHSKNPERMQRELATLYRDAGTSPVAGCLPLLAQAPLVAVIYAIFTRPEIHGGLNSLLADGLAGVPLGIPLGHTVFSGAIDPASVVVMLIAVLSITLAAELSRRLALRLAPPSLPAPEPAPGQPVMPTPSPGMMRALGFAPYLSLVAAVFVPFAATIYMAISALWGVGERWILARRYARVV
ncbi:YidC/Oxa1 family membrane protein insertase [Amnibacterium flavum]|uniref:YidC/Oxa1 family membrane protein insertase n=1 Tax=Amnibacterium flavum TaxID=2173173 RepID=UPI0014031128|nr:membrane protein insertase YidC [Amnibacterium flavum]